MQRLQLGCLSICFSLLLDTVHARVHFRGVKQHHQSKHKIPQQLILTGKWNSVEEVPGDVGKNLQHTISLNPQLHIRWFSNPACLEYLTKHFDEPLADLFEAEHRGSFRGDICRAAVLSREGGFYTDLDVQWVVPMTELVDANTSFMSVYGEQNDLLNAVIAAEPGNKIMLDTVEALRKWYSDGTDRFGPGGSHGWMGPATLMQGLTAARNDDCPDLDLQSYVRDKTCGPHNLRFYQQRHLECNDASAPQTPECPKSRVASHFDGLQYGLFEPGARGKLVGWPRFEKCGSFGCGGGGWDMSLANVMSFIQTTMKWMNKTGVLNAQDKELEVFT